MFNYAKPIFLKNLKNEKNITAFFVANFEYDKGVALLGVTGATKYKITVNGDFICQGPAEAPKNYCKFDSIDITSFVTPGINQIVIEVASYNLETDTGFIWAEVLCDSKCVAATGSNFIGFLDMERIQKCPPLENTYPETYIIGGQTMIQTNVEVVNPAVIPIKRDVPYPRYSFTDPKKLFSKGKIHLDEWTKNEEFDCNPFYELKSAEFSDVEKANLTIKLPVTLKKGEFATFDFGIALNGFLKTAFKISEKAEVMFVLSEKPLDEGAENAALTNYRLLTNGGFERETFEAFKFRYVTVFAKNGELEIMDLCAREFFVPSK